MSRRTLYGVLFVSLILVVFAPAQEVTPWVTLRLASADIPAGNTTNMCVVVSESGAYRLELLPAGPEKRTKKNTRVYVGDLTNPVLSELKGIIQNPDLVALGSVNSTETKPAKNVLILGAHIKRTSGNQSLAYTSYDGTNKLPNSVRPLIPWIKSLLKEKGNPIKGTEPNICRSLNLAPGFQSPAPAP